MTDAELTKRIKKVLSSDLVPLPPVAQRRRNEYGHEKEICGLCGTEVRERYRRSHYGKVHGYSTQEWRVKQLVKLVRRVANQKVSE